MHLNVLRKKKKYEPTKGNVALVSEKKCSPNGKEAVKSKRVTGQPLFLFLLLYVEYSSRFSAVTVTSK